MASRDRRVKHQLQTLQDARRSPSRALASAATLSLCVRGGRGFGQRATRAAASDGDLLPPRFDRLTGAQYLRRNFDGSFGIFSACGFVDFAPYCKVRRAVDYSDREDQLVD